MLYVFDLESYKTSIGIRKEILKENSDLEYSSEYKNYILIEFFHK